MPSYVDQMGRTVIVPATPCRIVSLVPSQTEFLFSLGLEKEVIGITKFCVHPEQWYRGKTRIGGTKNVNFEQIEALQPDLIIGNKEENTKADIEKLTENYPVWMSDITSIDSAFEMMEGLGQLLQKQAKADAIVRQVRDDFRQISHWGNQTVTYLIWEKPMMAAAAGTYINEMLHLIGLRNTFSAKKRYPITSIEELQAQAPDFLFLSSEPFPFSEKHLHFYQQKLPNTHVQLVDGEQFSWYGSRMICFKEYISKLK